MYECWQHGDPDCASEPIHQINLVHCITRPLEPSELILIYLDDLYGDGQYERLLPAFSVHNTQFDMSGQLTFSTVWLIAIFVRYTLLNIAFDHTWHISPVYVAACHARDHPTFNRATGFFAAHVLSSVLLAFVLVAVSGIFFGQAVGWDSGSWGNVSNESVV